MGLHGDAQDRMSREGYVTDRGTVVLDEVIYFIQGFVLQEGLLHVKAVAPGPAMFPGGKTEYSIHGPDGVLFISAQKLEMNAFEANHLGFVFGDFTISMEGKVGHPV